MIVGRGRRQIEERSASYNEAFSFPSIMLHCSQGSEVAWVLRRDDFATAPRCEDGREPPPAAAGQSGPSALQPRPPRPGSPQSTRRPPRLLAHFLFTALLRFSTAHTLMYLVWSVIAGRHNTMSLFSVRWLLLHGRLTRPILPQTRLYSFRLSWRIVSLTAAKTKRMFSVSEMDKKERD